MRLLDWGFFMGKDSRGFPFASYGIVVENTSSHVAIRTDVDIRLQDRAGQTLKVNHFERVDNPRVNGVDGWTRILFELGPGERAGVAGHLWAEADRVATMKVTLHGDSTIWEEPTTVAGRLRVRDVDIRKDATTNTATLRFQAKWPFQYRVTTGCVEAVFFNADGEVIGGGPVQITTPRGYFKPGWNRAVGGIRPLAPEADLYRTELYAAQVCGSHQIRPRQES